MMVNKSRKSLRKFYARYGYNPDDFKQTQIITTPSFKIKETPSISQSQDIASTPKKQKPRSETGSGFFVSKMGHVITNAHVVQSCNKVTIGDNAKKQVPAELINTDRSNDLALLQLSTLEMASAESKSLIQKLGIVVVPLASKGLLRSEDVRLGEKVLVAGYPFSDFMSNTIKVTTGVVSATRGMGDDSGQFQLDAAVQPGNSGGPIYDSGGNIVGVVVYGLNKLAIAKTRGSIPENVNFGIKASTVRQFLTSSGLPSKKSERTEKKSNQQLAEIAKNQALMVMCLQ
jgi:S1-C subfamily serine protease